MKYVQLSYVAIALFSAFSTAHADVLALKSGVTIEGTYTGGDKNTVKFIINDKEQVINVKDIDAITFTGAEANVVAPIKQANNVKPSAVNGAEIPAGTEFMIRTRDVLNSGKMSKGNKFTAVLEADIVVNNATLAQQGDTVYGEVIEVKKAGRIAGKAQIDIQLTGIRTDGTITAIKSNILKLTTEATGKRSLGGTARAAAIGGLIDGSDGAKTGAKVGVGAAILSPGTQVVVPSGSLLDFTFISAVKLK